MGGAPSIGNLFTQRIVIGVGDQAASNNANVVLSTYALGSCVGVVAFDPRACAGGILHIMLPESKSSPEKAAKQPAMFADTGLRTFFRALQGMGASARNCNLMMAGGASVLAGSDVFKIGDRNVAAVSGILKQSGLRPRHIDVGGYNNRTVHLALATGKVEMKMPSGITEYSLQ